MVKALYLARLPTCGHDHLLAVLRASGICLAYATQLPAQVDQAVLSLTRNTIVIGNITGHDNLQVIQNIMSLNDDQKTALTRFKRRESLVFIPGAQWPYPVHGFTPDIDINQHITATAAKPHLNIQTWHSLTQLPPARQHNRANTDNLSNSQCNTAKHTDKAATTASTIQNNNIQPDNTQTNPLLSLGLDAEKLLRDCIGYPFNKVRDRTKRLSMSGRVYESAKNELIQNGLLIASAAGKTSYLIATNRAYNLLSQSCPYKRATSIEHAFYVRMAAYYLKRAGLKVHTETPLGSQGHTIDVTASDASGNIMACEITLSTSNLLSNAAKLQDTAYRQIVWLCRNASTAKAVKAYFARSTSLPPELTAKFRYEFFARWINKLPKENN